MKIDRDKLIEEVSIKDAPEKIWLNIGDTDINEVKENGWKWNDLAEITWCSDKIDQCDIPYIRADLVSAHAIALQSEVRSMQTEQINLEAECLDRGITEYDPRSELLVFKGGSVLDILNKIKAIYADKSTSTVTSMQGDSEPFGYLSKDGIFYSNERFKFLQFALEGFTPLFTHDSQLKNKG